ncbi:MAG: transposase [Nodosilinea sp.]
MKEAGFLNVKLIWDNTSYHRARLMKKVAETLDITLEPLPAYSPDLIPVEDL